MADAGAVGAASLAIGQSIGVYQFFMPPLSAVREADKEDMTMRQNVLMGQLAAAAVAISIGVMLSALTGSKIPLFTSLFVALVIAVMYQIALGS